MKVLVIILSLFITTVANADVASQALNKVSEKISDIQLVLFLEKGITEVDIQLSDKDLDNELRINLLLGVKRYFNTGEHSNFFTQFSLHNSRN